MSVPFPHVIVYSSEDIMMSDTPSTHASLLVRLRDRQDDEAWQHFVQLYTPLIYNYARKHNLQDADAADLTQDVLQAVSKSIGRLDYDPQRGSFRGWLFTLVHHRLCDFLTNRKRHVHASGDSELQEYLHELPAPHQDLWNAEYENQVFIWATEQVRKEFTEKTWQAFYLTAVEGKPIPEVAEQLDLSVGAIYIARTRVQAKLKEKIEQIHWD